LVVTKKPGFQKPRTTTTATMTANSRPTTPPMTASERFEPSSAPGALYCGNWPYWPGCWPY
jgi:hypothetical protein